MPWPFDDQPDEAQYIPPAPMDYGPVGVPDSALAEAPGLAPESAPQFPGADNFWSRLARGSGPHPFNLDLSQAPNTGLTALLGLLTGFANQRTGQAAAGISDTEKQNQRLRESASMLATRRHEIRKTNEANQQAEKRIRLAASLRPDVADKAPEIVQAVGPDGKPRYILKSDAVGKEAPKPFGGLVQVAGPEGPVYSTMPNAVGQSPPEKPVGAEKLKPPTAAERGDLIYDVGLLNQLGGVRKSFNPRYVGPGHGLIGKGGQMAGLMSKDESSFRSGLAGIRNQILKMRSGGAVTPQEGQRLLDEMPTLDDPPDAFQSKLSTFEETARYIAQTRRNVLSETGVDLSKLSPLPGGKAQVARGTTPSRIRVVGPNGESGTVPSGTKLGAGWKAVP